MIINLRKEIVTKKILLIVQGRASQPIKPTRYRSWEGEIGAIHLPVPPKSVTSSSHLSVYSPVAVCLRIGSRSVSIRVSGDEVK